MAGWAGGGQTVRFKSVLVLGAIAIGTVFLLLQPLDSEALGDTSADQTGLAPAPVVDGLVAQVTEGTGAPGLPAGEQGSVVQVTVRAQARQVSQPASRARLPRSLRARARRFWSPLTRARSTSARG